jgi:hypothetical protein
METDKTVYERWQSDIEAAKRDVHVILRSETERVIAGADRDQALTAALDRIVDALCAASVLVECEIRRDRELGRLIAATQDLGKAGR